MFYSLESDQYNGNDLSVLAENLFKDHKITRIAWQRDPEYILWAIRDDGQLLGLTYIKEQQVWAWHRHNTKNGKFIDVAIIRNNDGEDEVFFVIKRNGEYYIEMLKSRNINSDINKSWFLDSALSYSGDATTTLSGLDHLEGQTVSIFSKGSVIENITVASSSITLPFPVTEAIVGLPYTSIISSMEAAITTQNKNSLSVICSIIGATFYFKETCRGRISATGGDDLSKWKDIGVSLQHDLSAPYTLCSGKFYYTLSSQQKLSDSEVARNKIHLRNDLPLPVTVCAIGVRVDAGNT